MYRTSTGTVPVAIAVSVLVPVQILVLVYSYGAYRTLIPGALQVLVWEYTERGPAGRAVGNGLQNLCRLLFVRTYMYRYVPVYTLYAHTSTINAVRSYTVYSAGLLRLQYNKYSTTSRYVQAVAEFRTTGVVAAAAAAARKAQTRQIFLRADT